MPHSYVGHDSFIYRTLIIQMWVMCEAETTRVESRSRGSRVDNVTYNKIYVYVHGEVFL